MRVQSYRCWQSEVSPNVTSGLPFCRENTTEWMCGYYCKEVSWLARHVIIPSAYIRGDKYTI